MRWLVLCCCLLSGLALAQTIDIKTLRALQAAQSAQEQGEFNKAEQLLRQLQPEKGSYAEALIWRTHGYVVWQKNHIAHAVQLLEQAYKSGQLTDEQRQEDALSLAKLNTQLERPKQALAYLEQVLDSQESLELRIYNWQMLGRYDQALPLAERYLAKQSVISDQWLNFMVAANAELRRFPAAQKWQKQLLTRHPQQVAQWRQLAALQQMSGNYVQAFATLRTAYQQGLAFSEADLDQLVALASAAEQPWQGARLLNELMQQGRLTKTTARQERLAQLQWQSRERSLALAHYQRLAEQSQQAKHWLTVVQLASEQELWPQAKQALQAAAKAGASRKEIRNWQDWLNTTTEP